MSFVPTSQQPPRRRSLVGCILPLVLVLALAAVGVTAVVLLRGGSEPEQKSYTSIPDTAGPAVGQAQAFTRLLRARGLACSDEKLAKVFSRGCYREDFDHDVRVELLGPVDGTLTEVEIRLDYIGADDQADAHRDFDDLVGDFVQAAGLGTADATVVRNELAGKDAEFRTGWGSAELQRSTSSTSSITFRRAGWKSPDLVAATLPGDLAAVEAVAVKRGYRCERSADSLVECSKGDELKIVANRALPTGLKRLYVGANTGRDDKAMDVALAEAGALLDALGGTRSAAVKDWYTQHRTAAGGMAYVAGLRAYLTVEDTKLLHYVQFDLLTPCRYNSKYGGFC